MHGNELVSCAKRDGFESERGQDELLSIFYQKQKRTDMTTKWLVMDVPKIAEAMECIPYVKGMWYPKEFQKHFFTLNSIAMLWHWLVGCIF